MNNDAEQYLKLNGEILPVSEGLVSVDDRGFLYGDSVFTTIRCYNGVPFRLNRHCERLNSSLRSPIVDIAYTVDDQALAHDIVKLIGLNQWPDSIARLAVTRGRGKGPVAPNDCVPTVLLTVRPYTQPDNARYAEGISLTVSSIRRDPHGQLGKHKLGSYFQCLLARREAIEAGFDDGVICDTDGNYLECSSSNIFAVIGGVLTTPDVSGNLLPGIARETVLECAKILGIEISLEHLTPGRAKSADEVFITNSALEIMPVARINDNHYHVTGPLTERLMNSYGDMTTGSQM